LHLFNGTQIGIAPHENFKSQAEGPALAILLVARGKRQQRDIPGLLDGAGEAPLVRGANSGEPARYDLAAFSHKALQQTHVAIRYGVDLLGAELADLLSAEKLAASTCATRAAAAAGSAA